MNRGNKVVALVLVSAFLVSSLAICNGLTAIQASQTRQVGGDGGCGGNGGVIDPLMSQVTASGCTWFAGYQVGNPPCDYQNTFAFDNVFHVSDSDGHGDSYQQYQHSPSMYWIDVYYGGNKNWQYPDKIYTVDNNFAFTGDYAGSVWTSKGLVGTGFGFTIPSDGIISSIILQTYRMRLGQTSGYVHDYYVRLVKWGQLVGQNLADTQTNWIHGGSSPYTKEWTYYLNYSNPLWGVTWSPAEINDASFGVGIAITGYSSGSYPTFENGYIDVYKITVNYIIYWNHLDLYYSFRFTAIPRNQLDDRAVVAWNLEGFLYAHPYGQEVYVSGMTAYMYDFKSSQWVSMGVGLRSTPSAIAGSGLAGNYMNSTGWVLLRLDLYTTMPQLAGSYFSCYVDECHISIVYPV